MKKLLFVAALGMACFALSSFDDNSNEGTSDKRRFWGSTTGCMETQEGGVRCCTTIYYVMWIAVNQTSTCSNL